MLISDVMKLTGLTKKAINYYAEIGLIEPIACESNSYRIFNDRDVKKLKVIAVLKQLDMPLEDIRKILNNTSPINVLLERHIRSLQEDIHHFQDDIAVLQKFIETNPAKKIEDMDDAGLKTLLTSIEMSQMKRSDFVRRQMKRIFPGKMGIFFSYLFGNIVYCPIDTQEKRDAWLSLVQGLDEQDTIEIPDEVQEYIDWLMRHIPESRGNGKPHGFEKTYEQTRDMVANWNRFLATADSNTKETVHAQIRDHAEQ